MSLSLLAGRTVTLYMRGNFACVFAINTHEHKICLVIYRIQWSRYTVNVLKFQTLLASQKGLDKNGRLRSDCF